MCVWLCWWSFCIIIVTILVCGLFYSSYKPIFYDKMPNTCVVPGCKGNYRSGPKVQVFSFPKDPELHSKWLHAIRRKDFTPTKNNKLGLSAPASEAPSAEFGACCGGSEGRGAEMTPSAKVEPYCGQGLHEFQRWYRPIHGPLAIVICSLGCVANAFNVAVLSRPPMRSPTNAILTALAVADLLVMAEYIPFAAYTILSTAGQPQHHIYTFPWAAFTLFHANFGQVFHTVSIWLTVLLAVWRYVAVGHPLRNREWCGRARAHRAILVAYVASPLLCAPFYFGMSILSKQAALPDGFNGTLYFVGHSDLSHARDDLLLKLNFWLYAVLIKLLPCALLTLLSLALVSALAGTERRRRQVIKRGPAGGAGSSRRGAGVGRRADRTTGMLLAVLLLFLLSEVPQGVLGLLSVIIGKRFFQDCYHRLGEAMDLLALANGAVNFVVYYTMSRQFRDTFSSVFCRRAAIKGTPSEEDGNGNANPAPPMEAPLRGQSTWISRRDSGAAETQVTAV